MTRRRSPSRGYTAVELLMSIAVLGVGVSGIIAMQKITVASNAQARNLSVATQIARSWQDRLVADAATWNTPTPTQPASDRPSDTEWLQLAPTGGWVVPDASIRGDFGPGFDALGNYAAVPGDARYCTHIRLTWLVPEAPNAVGLIRTEVRVLWVREGASPCGASTDPATVDTNPQAFHSVYLTSAVQQNSLSQ